MSAGARRRRCPLAGASLLALPLALTALACESDARGAFDLRPESTEPSDCVAVLHADLGLALPPELEVAEIHAFVGDGPSSPGGWALVSVPEDTPADPDNPDPDALELALVRVPASPTDLVTVDYLDRPPSVGDTAQLRANGPGGEAWLLLTGVDLLELYALSPGLGVWASNAMLGNFPNESADACGLPWQYRLFALEGVPHLTAIPRCSTGTSVDIGVLELDPSTLEFVAAWILDFDPCADLPDPELCAATFGTTQEIRAGSPTSVASGERVGLGLWQRRKLSNPDAGLPDVSVYDVAFFDLRIPEDWPKARLITFREVWAQPVVLDDPVTAVDPYSFQVYIDGLGESPGALLRLDTITDSYLQTSLALPLEGRGQLVQLSNESAMLGPAAGEVSTLLGVPLVAVDEWPVWRELDLHQADADIIGVEAAGVGEALLRRGGAAPQVLGFDCPGL